MILPSKLLALYATCALLVIANTSRFMITNMRCLVLNKTIGDFKLCSLKTVKSDTVEINVRFLLLQKSLNDLTIRFRLRKRSYRLQNTLYEYKVDACAFFRNEGRNPMARFFYRVFDLQKCSTINHSCPLNPDVILNSCQLNMNILNILAISPGEYTIETNWLTYNVHVADVNISLKIV